MNCLSSRSSVLVAALASLAAPLLIALLWGAPLGDDAYVAFAHARNLAADRELAAGLTTTGTASPLYLVLWLLLEKLGIPLLGASVVLGGIGWSATALALYGVCRSIGRPLAAVASAVLVVLNPLVASTLGTEVSWVVALFWIVVWLAIRGDWRAWGHWPVQGSLLACMLWAHFDWTTLAWAIAMLGLQWRERRRFPLSSTLVLAVAVSAYVLVAIRVLDVPLLSPRLGLAGLSYLGQLLAESDLYWLGLPLVGMGLLAAQHRVVWMGLLGCLLVSVGDGTVAGPCLLVASALLVGLGVDWGTNWVERRALVRSVRLARRTIPVSVCLALIALLPLGIAQISSLRHRYQARPYARYQIEQQVAAWLSSHGEPGAVVLGSARVGYLADRPSVLWNGTAPDQAQISLLIDALDALPPEYCVSTNTIAWNWLTQTGWFQERYELLGRYETAYDARSPLLVWGYRTSGFDRGQIRLIDESLSKSVHLVHSKHWPERIEPGDTVYVTLYLQATQAVGSAFQARMRVFSPVDGANWAYRNRMAPSSMPVDWWQPGQVIAERFAMTTTTETPVGAYPLDLSVTGTRVAGLVLGYVSVPWRGTMEGATRAEATFSDQIRLLGFEAPDSGTVGSEIDVMLYWEAIRPPDDDYIVFVHLVGPTGQPETGHDGIPMDRRYPTLGWHPGDIVPDTHPLLLKPDMPPGTYTLKVGMYRWPSIERLPARDGGGIEQPDRAIALSTVEVR